MNIKMYYLAWDGATPCDWNGACMYPLNYSADIACGFSEEEIYAGCPEWMEAEVSRAANRSLDWCIREVEIEI